MAGDPLTKEPLTENCPKCGLQMFNWPRSITRCAKCGHEWAMKEQGSVEPIPGCVHSPPCGDSGTHVDLMRSGRTGDDRTFKPVVQCIFRSGCPNPDVCSNHGYCRGSGRAPEQPASKCICRRVEGLHSPPCPLYYEDRGESLPSNEPISERIKTEVLEARAKQVDREIMALTSNPHLLGDLRDGLCSSSLCRVLRRQAADKIERLTREVDNRRHLTGGIIEEKDRLRAALRHIHTIQQDQVMQYDEKLQQIGRICYSILISGGADETTEHVAKVNRAMHEDQKSVAKISVTDETSGWVCTKCQQLNAAWASDCGRCGNHQGL